MASTVYQAPELPAEVEAAEWAVDEMNERTDQSYGPKRHEVEAEEAERREEALRAARLFAKPGTLDQNERERTSIFLIDPVHFFSL